MHLDIVLGENAEYTITYKLYDNRVATLIWQRFQEADYEYVSRTQFYNWGESESDVKAELDHSIAMVKQLAPDITFNDSDNLNTLHVNFPDLVENATGELRHWLSMFNYHLHHYEDITRFQNRRFLLSTASGGPGPVPLLDEDYKLFTPTRTPGVLYMNYPHVGKHPLELFYDNDINIPKEHIVPTTVLKNDLLAWFGPKQHSNPDLTKKHVRRWLLQIADRLPYGIDDPRMSIGWIPLGEVTHDVDYDKVGHNKFVNNVIAR